MALPSQRRWLGQYPARTLLRLGAAVVGIGVVGATLGLVWPEADRVAPDRPSAEDPTSLAAFPSRPVTVLVVGVDSDGLQDPVNRAAPKGPANADSLMLVRVQAGEPLQILQIPVELAVHLPGRKGMVPLSASYRDGGVALTADIIRELVGLPEGEPERFVVVPRKALRSLVDGLGQVEVNLSQSFSHTDKSQNYRVNLQAGRQTLNGAQAEQLVRLRQDPLDEQARRIRQQWLVMGLAEQLRQPNAITLLPGLLGEISADVSSDLSSTEWLSLTAATLSSNQPPRISSLPLAPRAGKQILRQLDPSAPRPLWEPVNGQPAP